MFQKLKSYYIIFIILAIISGILVYWGSSRIIQQDKNARELQLIRANQVAATELNNALMNYATFLSGLKSHIEINDSIPDKAYVKSFILRQLEELRMDPPFSVTYVDTNHIIKYDIVFDSTNEIFLKGKSMKSIIGSVGVRRMDTLMRRDNFYASNPTNLLEGKVALPLRFGVLDEYGNTKGYITSVALFAPIVNRVYEIIDKDKYVLSFQSGNGNNFDRSRSYNRQQIYAEQQDPEYFKNFEIPEENYVYQNVDFYNNTFKIGTAYKYSSQTGFLPIVYSSIWYIAILAFMMFLLTRFYIYKRKNETIAVQKEQLQELVATKNKFFSIVAHDLRSPLTSVINFLDLIQQDDKNGITNRKIAEALEDSSKNSLTLLDNLLKWSKIQTGKIRYNPEDLDLLKMTSDQLKVLSNDINEKNLRVDLECSFDGKVSGDKNMIASVIRNLLVNAIKFSHKKGIIVVEISKIDNYVSMSVEDNGLGIPATFMNKLFDITEVTIQPGTNNERGSGIGLILCKEFIEMHKGSLVLESAENKGTIAIFKLPLN